VSEATPLAWYWLFSWKTILLDCYQRGTRSYLGAIPATPLQPCCGINHGNQIDFCLSILYKVDIVIINSVVDLFIIYYIAVALTAFSILTAHDQGGKKGSLPLPSSLLPQSSSPASIGGREALQLSWLKPHHGRNRVMPRLACVTVADESGDKKPDDERAVKNLKTKRSVVAATSREEGGRCGGKGEERETSLLSNFTQLREGGGRGGWKGEALPSLPNYVPHRPPMTNSKCTGGMKRPLISNYHPCDKVIRDNMKYDKNASMYAYLKLPRVRPNNPPMVAADAPATSAFTTTASTATPATNAATAAQGKYIGKMNDGGASDEWISIMLSTAGDRKQANEALLMNHPTIIISRSTLNSQLNSAKAKANLDASGDKGRDLDLFKCLKNESTIGLTSKEDRAEK